MALIFTPERRGPRWLRRFSALPDPWWRTIRGWWICYHPRDDRIAICEKVERCGWCGDLRFRDEPYWLPKVFDQPARRSKT